MVRRLRFKRAAFAAQPVEDVHVRNPLGGNYYPLSSSMFLRDILRQQQLILVTDRGQGTQIYCARLGRACAKRADSDWHTLGTASDCQTCSL